MKPRRYTQLVEKATQPHVTGIKTAGRKNRYTLWRSLTLDTLTNYLALAVAIGACGMATAYLRLSTLDAKRQTLEIAQLQKSENSKMANLHATQNTTLSRDFTAEQAYNQGMIAYDPANDPFKMHVTFDRTLAGKYRDDWQKHIDIRAKEKQSTLDTLLKTVTDFAPSAQATASSE